MVGMIVAVGSGNGRKREEATLKHPSLYVHEYVFYSFFVHIVFRAWHVLIVLTIASVVIHIAAASVLRPGTLATSSWISTACTAFSFTPRAEDRS